MGIPLHPDKGEGHPQRPMRKVHPGSQDGHFGRQVHEGLQGLLEQDRGRKIQEKGESDMAFDVRVRLYFHESFQDLVEKTILTHDEKTGKNKVDFNKIVRMPDELSPDKAPMGEGMRKGLSLYMSGCEKIEVNRYMLKELKKHVKTSLVPLTFGKVPLDAVSYFRMIGGKENKEEFQRLFRLGVEQAERIMEHGGANWVDWRYRNWGTKYNAFDTDVEKGHIDFTVSERPCIEAVRNLSTKLPQIPFAMTYAEKDFGKQVGFMLVRNDDIDQRSSKILYYSECAIDLGRDLWGIKDRYQFDTRTKKFVNLSKEETQLNA